MALQHSMRYGSATRRGMPVSLPIDASALRAPPRRGGDAQCSAGMWLPHNDRAVYLYPSVGVLADRHVDVVGGLPPA